MTFHTHDGIFWCVCAGQVVFLDLDRDRYFCLRPEASAAFLHHAGSSRTVDHPPTIFGIPAAGDAAWLPTPDSVVRPVLDLAVGASRDARISDIARALVAQRRAASSIRRGRLADVVRRMAHDPAPPVRSAVDIGSEVRRVAAAFASTALSFQKATQCLPRAMAARTLCRRFGVSPTLVFGVRLAPFAAHCWAQWHDAVVVGDLDEVRMFTPILAVS